MENLSSFYQSKGQALPSVQQRQGVASQAGIQNYSGTAQQNTQLLNFLKTQQTPQAQQQNAVPVSSNIPANIIGTQQVQIPQAQPIQAQPVENIASTLIEQTKTEATPLQGTQENLISKILENQLGLQGEAQALADANLQAGVNTKIAELNDLNSKILQKQAEVQQDDITLVSQMRAEETRDTLLPFAQMGQAKLAGDAQIVRALKNAEIGVLNAQAIGKQGDIQLAKDTAKQAVELKFAPFRERIALYQSQLEAIAPLLDREEKAQAREQDIKTKLALSKIDKLETFQSKALENAISNNAPQSVISKILNANSIEGITSVGSNYITSDSDRLDLALKKATLSEKYANIAKTKAEAGQVNVKPATDTQVTNAGYASRIAQSNKIIDSKLDTLKNMNYLQFKLIESNSPLANKTLTPDQRQAAQAMRNFITAKLRKESGAAISPTEFDDARTTYFPALGDDEGTLANKKQLRDSVLNNLVQGSGSAYQTNPLDSYLDVVVTSTSPTGTTSSSYAQSIYQSLSSNKK